MTTHTTSRATTAAAHSTDWMTDGLCRKTGTAVFFPEGRGAAAAADKEQAKEVCGRCPVQQVCLEWAVSTGQSAGIWGGASERERRALRRRRRPAEVQQSSYARCVEEQEFIEQRVAEGASHRTIADELRVCHSAVGRAWRFFQSEKAQAQEQDAVVVQGVSV